MAIPDQILNHSFHARGKLLLSGEYLVLKGALALAIPLKNGQSMHIKTSTKEGLIWKASHPDGEWFSAVFDQSLSILKTNNTALSKKLRDILNAALKLKNESPLFLSGKEVTTHLDFNPYWGWGSSSTLISNIADWLQVDPYQLLKNTFGGSGYDIACAKANGPIFYRLNEQKIPETIPTDFAPPFARDLWTIYLNKKQSSSNAIAKHTLNTKITDDLINRISKISVEMTLTKSREQFMALMNEHESVIGDFTGLVPVQKQLFQDFQGAVKSLGAWGGDFILALSQLPDNEMKNYFQTKGLDILFRLQDIKLNNPDAR